jgi:hypothetical protein
MATGALRAVAPGSVHIVDRTVLWLARDRRFCNTSWSPFLMMNGGSRKFEEIRRRRSFVAIFSDRVSTAALPSARQYGPRSAAIG